MACSANKKLVVFIVDDEPGPLQTLANDLKEMPEVGEVCTFSSYSDAVYPLITKQPDVVFLDVEVPGKSGLDFLRDIRPRISFTFHEGVSKLPYPKKSQSPDFHKPGLCYV